MTLPMLLRLYKGPIIFVLLGILFQYLFGTYFPESLTADGFPPDMIERSRSFAPRVFWLFMLMAMIWAVFPSFRLWSWAGGRGDRCPACDGLAIIKTGRSGLYYKCLACGEKTRKQ